MTDRRPRRLSALREAIATAHLDALLVSSLPNIRYLTGFSGSNALLLVTPTTLHLITDFRYETQVVEEVGNFATTRIESSSLWTGLWESLSTVPVRPGIIGFESPHVIHRDFERLLSEQEGGRWQWRPQSEIVERLREAKDPDEVACIEQAAGMAIRALEHTLAQVRRGMTELQVAGVLEHALRDEGSEGFPFPSIVASGPRAALPHARTSSRVVQTGDFLLLDFGAEFGGYCSDVTRTIVVGHADEEQREVYEIVRIANERAAAGVRAGMLGKDADAIARGYIAEQGFADNFGHGLGHGLGLEVHEAPRLSRTAESPLTTNAVVTIEPGIYRPGWGGIRIEDDVLLAPNGPRVLTHFTRELIEVA